jgi:hypothetical protein
MDGVAVAAGPVIADRPLTNGSALAERLTARVAEALGPGTVVLKPSTSVAEARRAARRSRTLVFLSLSVVGGEARVTAEAGSTSVGFWDRLRGMTSDPGRHGFAGRPIDGEIASFLPPVPLVLARVEKAALPTSDVVALACGDVDGDSALEIAVVGRRKIQLGRVRGHRFAPYAEAAWAALEPISPAPLREPLAGAEIVAGHGLLVGSTDRRSAVWLTPALQKKAELGAVVPIAGLGCLSRSGVALGSVSPCLQPTGAFDLPGGADAAAGANVVARDGAARRVSAVRSATDGALVLKGTVDGAERSARVAGAGGAVALADLDLDGVPELLASNDTMNAAEDALVVRSWDGGNTLTERARLPVPGGIRAIAVCPPEDAGVPPIVVATESSLWIVR